MGEESAQTAGSGRHAAARWLLAAVLAALAWCAVVLGLGTTHPLVVTVGRSMLPTLHTGELAVIRGVSPFDLHVGEIVAVRIPPVDQHKYNYAPEIVHRIVGLSLQGGQLTVQTKGDHETPDPFTVPASAVDGSLLVAIPGVGYVLLFLHSRPGLIALGGLVLLALVYVLLGSLTDVMEGPAGEGAGTSAETGELALAIREYAVHLQSHTKVVRELGGTTEHLWTAAATQNEILRDLRQVVSELAGDPTPREAVWSVGPRSRRLPEGPPPGWQAERITDSAAWASRQAATIQVYPAPRGDPEVVGTPAETAPQVPAVPERLARRSARSAAVLRGDARTASRLRDLQALDAAVVTAATVPLTLGPSLSGPLPPRRQRRRLPHSPTRALPAPACPPPAIEALPSRRARKRRRPAHA